MASARCPSPAGTAAQECGTPDAPCEVPCLDAATCPPGSGRRAVVLSHDLYTQDLAWDLLGLKAVSRFCDPGRVQVGFRIEVRRTENEKNESEAKATVLQGWPEGRARCDVVLLSPLNLSARYLASLWLPVRRTVDGTFAIISVFRAKGFPF